MQRPGFVGARRIARPAAIAVWINAARTNASHKNAGRIRIAQISAALVCVGAVALIGCAPAMQDTGTSQPAPVAPGMVDVLLTPDDDEGDAVVTTEQSAIVVTDRTVPGLAGGSASVPVRTYTPAPHELAKRKQQGQSGRQTNNTEPWATLVWAHGGSFVHGTLDWPEADWVARQFAGSGVRVVSVDYVLASDTVKAPAPATDVAAALAWASSEFDGALVVGGASAGAHLAVLATLMHSDRVRGSAATATQAGRLADALILQYPTLHRVQRDDAALAAAVEGLPEQRRFRADRIAEMYNFYLGAGVTPVAGELPADRLAQLPATVIVNADLDELRASGEEFAEQLQAAGVTVSTFIQPGTIHGYMNRPEESERARQDAQATIVRFVSELRRVL